MHKSGTNITIMPGEAQFGEWPHMCAVLKRETVETEVEGGYGGITVEEEVRVIP